MGIRATAVERWPVARAARPGHRRRHDHPDEGQRRTGQAGVRRRGPGGGQDGSPAPRGGQPGRGGLARRQRRRRARGRRAHPPDGERHVPLRRGDDRPRPGRLPGTPVHGPGRPRLRRPRRVARRRAGRAHAARGERRGRGAAAVRGQAVDGRGLVRQPPLPVVHSGRTHEGLPPLRHVRLVLVAARHLLARGGRRRRGREPGPRRAGRAGRPARRRRGLLRGGRVGRQPLGAHGGPRHGGTPAPDQPAPASARRAERGRALVGGQGTPRARRRHADRRRRRTIA